MANLCSNLDQSGDRVSETFRNKTILITGGTGFIGNVIIEKILRQTDVRKIYVLIRPKRSKSPEERLSEVFREPVFDLLRQRRGDSVLDKVQAVAGDIGHPELGLSSKDRKVLIEETEFIIHGAATVRFDINLKTAVLFNTRGVKLMLELAQECKKLMVFCYISTAFCHSDESVLHEKTYNPPFDPEVVIKMCETFDDKTLDAITPSLVKKMPNTYILSKALSEGIVNKALEHLPAIIVRPSVILPVWKEPLPGWTNNFNGPVGLLVAAGKGVLRTMYGNPNNCLDMVPVDVAANAFMCVMFIFLVLDNKKQVYNITSFGEHDVTLQQILEIGRKIVTTRTPLNVMLWYPGGSMTRSKTVHYISFFLFQWIPAVVVDIILAVAGYRPFLKHVQKKLLKGYAMFEYFVNTQTSFYNNESLAYRNLLTNTERENYRLDGEGINYEEYFHDCVLSARRYLLKDSDESLPAAKRLMRVMWWVDKVCKTFILFGLSYVIWKIASSLNIITDNKQLL